MIRLNVEVALYRRNSGLGDWPVLEVISISAVTAAISYLVCGHPSFYFILAHSIPDCFCTVIALFLAYKFPRSIIRCLVSRPQNSCQTFFRNAIPTRATIMACASKCSTANICLQNLIIY